LRGPLSLKLLAVRITVGRGMLLQSMTVTPLVAGGGLAGRGTFLFPKVKAVANSNAGTVMIRVAVSFSLFVFKELAPNNNSRTNNKRTIQTRTNYM
jgi:hypothetical protein